MQESLGETMTYSRCKCGRMTCWSSGEPDPPCKVCSDCGSTLSDHPEYHADPKPHSWVTRYNETTGVPYKFCELCYVAEHSNHSPEPWTFCINKEGRSINGFLCELEEADIRRIVACVNAMKGIADPESYRRGPTEGR